MDLLDPCSHKYPILEERGDYVLRDSTQHNFVVYRNFRFTTVFMYDKLNHLIITDKPDKPSCHDNLVSDSNTSWYEEYDVDLAFKASEKLVTLLELIKYNFDEDVTYDIEYKRVIPFNETFILEMHGYEVWVCNRMQYEVIHKYNVLATDLYDIINNPLLQTHRINHSKPINKTNLELI